MAAACKKGVRGGLFEKGIEDAVVRMLFGHWVPLLVHTEVQKPFSHSRTTDTLKNGGLCYSGNSKGLRPPEPSGSSS